MRLAAILLSAAIASICTAPAAQDGSPAGGSSNCTSDAFKQNVSGSESGGKYDITNPAGFMGKYQMGEQALIDAGYARANGNVSDNQNISWTGKDGVNSTQDFLNNVNNSQENAYNKYLSNSWQQIKTFGFDKYVGQTYNGTTITESGLLKGMQFGNVRMKEFFANGMSCSGGVGMDGNKKCIGDYIQGGNGFDVSGITGGGGSSGGSSSCGSNGNGNGKDNNNSGSEGNANASSRTCPPTMKIIQGIECGRFPASIQSFCNTYKPYLMTMSKCNEAETWAKGQGMGQHRDNCAKQSDAQGTMSWGYVLACSKAKDEPPLCSNNQLKDIDSKGASGGQSSGGQSCRESGTGSDGSKATPAGAADDPGCYDRIEKMGVKFTRLNKIRESKGGFNCVVPTALAVKSFSKTTMTAPGTIMNCNVAEAFEKLSSQIGVTRVKSYGAFVCRGINNGSSGARGRLSEHGEGLAFDVAAWEGNGGTWNPSPGTRSHPTYLAVTSKGPGVGFRCILTPYWYATKSSPLQVGHIHLGVRDNCPPKI